MNVEWEVMLSYDAKDAFYKLINEDLDFDKIQDETKDFRLSLIILLLDSGAENIKSYCKSTVLFNITLPQKENPTTYFYKLFEANFEVKQDFVYMLHCTVNHNNYTTFSTNNELSIHAPNFEIEVESAKKLLQKIKKS